MCRTLIRDCFSGDKLHQANSVMTIVIVFAPIFAPIIGGTIVVILNWRFIFLFLTIFSIFVFYLQFKYLKETCPHNPSKKSLFSTYALLYKEKSFLPYTLCLVFTFGGIAVFEASLGVLLGNVFKLNPQVIGLLFILPCPFFIVGSFAAGRLSAYCKLNSILFAGIVLAAASSVIMLLLSFIGTDLIGVMFPLCFYMMAAGLICPTATTGALEPLGNIAGTAGASLGGIQNLGAGILTLLSSFILQATQRPLSIFLTLISILSILVFWVFIKNKRFSHMEKRFATDFEI